MIHLRRAREEEQGVALLEFALLAPIFIGILAAGLEFSRALKHIQVSASLSREVASIAYRECAGDEPDKVPGCLDLVRDKIQALADSVMPNSEIVVSVYQYVEATNTYSQLGLETHGGKYTTQYSLGGGKINGITDDQLIIEQERIVIGEAYVPWVSAIEGIPNIFNFSPSVFYDSTII